MREAADPRLPEKLPINQYMSQLGVSGIYFGLSVWFGFPLQKRHGIGLVQCLIKSRDAVQNFRILNSSTND